MKYTILILLLACLFACTKQVETKAIKEAKIEEIVKAQTVTLLPYEDVSTEEIHALKGTLEKEFKRLLSTEVLFKVAENKPLPEKAYVKSRNRYDSYKILIYERNLIKGNEVIIGITHKDICADVHGKKNYGNIGRGLINKQVCIVSDKRLSNKSDFWKPILHEYIHTYYAAQHCDNNDDSCIMQDCTGKGNFRIKNALCESCRNKILTKS